MKIIKHGEKPKMTTFKRFKCERCGCVFEADEQDYKPAWWRNEIGLECKCPDCGKAVFAWGAV